MNKLILLAVVSAIAFSSCKKEKFPDRDDLAGNWMEPQIGCGPVLSFKQENVYIFTMLDIDTLSYRLDKKRGLIFLSSPTGESRHKILLNKKEKTLTIWGLFSSTPENGSARIFEKQ